MIAKVYRKRGAGYDRSVIDFQDGTFSWEGETPQFIGDRLGDRSEACFSASFAEESGSLVLKLGEEAACPS